MANSVNPDEMAIYESSHLDIYCLQKYRFWSKGLKSLKKKERFFFFYILLIKDSFYICRNHYTDIGLQYSCDLWR